MGILFQFFIPSLASLAACDDYIVVLDSSSSASHSTNHMEMLSSRSDINVKHVYDIGHLKGYAATFDPSVAQELQNSPEVSFVERDIPIKQHSAVQCVTQQGAPSWGMQRVSETKQPLNGTYTYQGGAGTDVDIYLIDAGVRVTHAEFEGRARFGANVAGGSRITDPDGHGTHCAGVAASKSYGICKSCSIISVIAFDDDHHCSASTILAGFQWVSDNFDASRKNVISISLGGDPGETSDAMDSAVQALVETGVHVVGSAGNYLGDACRNSPARAASAITVSSTSNEFVGSDFFSPAANYGKCVNILAPGDAIKSLGHNSDTEVDVEMSGTSMATPHVAGVLALLASTNPAMTLSEVQSLMLTNSLSGLVELLPADTPNKLLHNPCASADAIVV